MVGRLDTACNRGVRKKAMGKGEDNGGGEEHNKAHLIDKTGAET